MALLCGLPVLLKCTRCIFIFGKTESENGTCVIFTSDIAYIQLAGTMVMRLSAFVAHDKTHI